MTTDQEAENVANAVRHLLTQRGKDAENWRRQSKDWEEQCKALRAENDQLRAYVEAHRMAESRVAVLRAALTDLLTGAEQMSQSHADVAAKCRAVLGERNG